MFQNTNHHLLPFVATSNVLCTVGQKMLPASWSATVHGGPSRLGTCLSQPLFTAECTEYLQCWLWDCTNQRHDKVRFACDSLFVWNKDFGMLSHSCNHSTRPLQPHGALDCSIKRHDQRLLIWDNIRVAAARTAWLTAGLQLFSCQCYIVYLCNEDHSTSVLATCVFVLSILVLAHNIYIYNVL